MEKTIVKKEKIIENQSQKIDKLFKMVNSLSIEKDIEDLNGLGFKIEVLFAQSFDNYFKTANQLKPDKFIFSFPKKKR